MAPYGYHMVTLIYVPYSYHALPHHTMRLQMVTMHKKHYHAFLHGYHALPYSYHAYHTLPHGYYMLPHGYLALPHDYHTVTMRYHILTTWLPYVTTWLPYVTTCYHALPHGYHTLPHGNYMVTMRYHIITMREQKRSEWTTWTSIYSTYIYYSLITFNINYIFVIIFISLCIYLHLCTNLPPNTLLTSLRRVLVRKWKTRRSRCDARRVPAAHRRVAAASQLRLRICCVSSIFSRKVRDVPERSSSAGASQRRRGADVAERWKLAEKTRIWRLICCGSCHIL